ncbi:hypothetical protein NP493_5g02083 [Ridgeia piscesae]|uniref:Helicase-associated domain-containing protein n=1 Tax=Ridgeia piscesae TaxID=27915 RepID=A0AAD9PFC1_RIDPI|nr:hypothetical protein NP493_5g02083 [Ridgeia piscesae]
MLRTRLEELCLQIKMLKLGRIETFVGKAMQPPSMEALHHAISTLVHLNALDEQEELTPLGYHLAKMPCDPHTSKMLLFGAMFSCLSPILTVGASLSFKDAFYIPMGKERLADQKRQEMAGDTRSDHLMLISAYEGWERAKDRGTASQYCWEHFLSASTLKMLQDMRRQFAQFLHEMGFLKSANPHAADANRNSGNKQLIKAIICAGLYPNVANIVKVKKNVRGDSSLSTKTEKRVLLHPQSVNWGMTQFNSRWLVYHLKMMTSKIFLYDTTMVSPYPLLFFGGNIHVTQEGGVDCVIIDGWIKFRANKRIARLVKELRIELDRLLAYKVTHPGASCWQPQDKEGVLLQAIIDLITTEDACMVSSGVRLLR